jgi:RNA polymerase sigma-70 factor (ECF subfamily)
MAAMNIAITSYRRSAARQRADPILADRSQAKLRNALSKKPRAPESTHKPAELRERKPDSSSLMQSIRMAQSGDAAAFETLYHLYNRRVYALCLRMLGNPVDAEDLTQEAFLQLFRKIHTFRGESAFTSWLHRLTANVVLMSFRKKRPIATSLDEMIRPDEDGAGVHLEIGGPDLRLKGLFDRMNVETAIEQLPEGYKAMFILHDIHGYEHNEIAEILGCSVGNSKSQLHKARKKLREFLRRDSSYSARENRAAARVSMEMGSSY